MSGIEVMHVVNRQFLEAADASLVIMTVGVPGINHVVQIFFPEFLIVAFPKRNFQVVNRIFAQSLKSSGLKPGSSSMSLNSA